MSQEIKDIEQLEEVELNPSQEKGSEEEVNFSKAAQLDFSDIEEDVECSYDLETRVRVLEAVLFISDKPVSLSVLVSAFGEEKPVTKKHVKEALEFYEKQLVENNKGFRLHNVDRGYQLRTAEELKEFLQNTIKARSFRLTGPSLETLAMIAYKQPCTKSDIDDIRGVDSSHLVRALMDRDLVAFAGKSDLPGKPMLYKTTHKFLEVFGLRNIKELPSLAEIEALLPNGIGDEEEEKETLSEVANRMSEEFEGSYSAGEEELGKINEQLSDISTETQFFEEEKRREKERKNKEKAENIREALLVGEEVSTRDQNWLVRYEESLASAGDSENIDSDETTEEEQLLAENKNDEDATDFEDEGEEDLELDPLVDDL